MYQEDDLVRIAKRDNNKKRSYLVVNRLQGKHIPVKPKEAFSLFNELAQKVKAAYEGDKVLVIGFAETATAIGSAVAMELGAMYMQTTRENIPGAEYLFFSEEHSHASSQRLVKNDLDKVIGEVDRIIFVEDEITTGKTILNLIRVLETAYGACVKYAIASLLNGMDQQASSLYEEKKISLHYLLKTEHEKYTEIAERFSEDGTYVPCCQKKVGVPEFTAELGVNPRRLISIEQYREACRRLWEQVDTVLPHKLIGRVLVLGTEEFMYPALYVAGQLEQKGLQVLCHSTTRSPIAASSSAEYPFHTRYELRSLYDPQRVTYLYDLEAYDQVIIITDADTSSAEGLYTLVNAVRLKSEDVVLIRWE